MCVSPIRKVISGEEYYFPCGCCPECLSVKRKDYAQRLYYDMLLNSDVQYFITLTYNDKSLRKTIDRSRIGEVPGVVVKYHNPSDDVIENGNRRKVFSNTFYYTASSKTGFLYRPDFQKFMKRFRKKLYKDYGIRIRFFACGEYGSDGSYIGEDGRVRSKTHRPHYHLVIWFRSNDLTRKGKPHVLPPLSVDVLDSIIKTCWPYMSESSLSCSQVRDVLKCSNYISKYLNKQSGESKRSEHFTEHASPMFRFISTHLGDSYADYYIKKCLEFAPDFSKLNHLYECDTLVPFYEMKRNKDGSPRREYVSAYLRNSAKKKIESLECGSTRDYLLDCWYRSRSEMMAYYSKKFLNTSLSERLAQIERCQTKERDRLLKDEFQYRSDFTDH